LAHENPVGVNHLAWAPDGERFALSSREQTAIYALGSTEPLQTLATSEAYQVAFSPCGGYLAVAAGSAGKPSLLLELT
jgi:WD40 repeat protein